MTNYYTLLIQVATPSNPQIGWIWVKPTESKAYILIKGSWIQIASSAPLSSYVEGFYWRSQIIQASAPIGTDIQIGRIWIDSNDYKAYIYLDSWILFLTP